MIALVENVSNCAVSVQAMMLYGIFFTKFVCRSKKLYDEIEMQ